MNEQQQQTFKLAEEGSNLFITGSAGVGKSFLLNKITKMLEKKHKKSGAVLVTAPTGLASFNVGGITLHKAFSFPRGEFYLSRRDVDTRWTIERLSPIKTLIIDEISMASRYKIDMIDKIMQVVKNNFEPFGGVQVIFVGDFMQLPPIEKDAPDSQKNLFAFLAKAWSKEANIKTCYLTEKVRQKDGDPLIDILDGIRGGKVGQDIYDLLDSRAGEQESHMSSILPTNAMVTSTNHKRLGEIDGELKVIKGVGQNLTEWELKSVFNNSLVEKELNIKIGAKIMFIKNDVLGRYYNGKMGIVKKISKTTVFIEDLEGVKISLQRDNFFIDDRKSKKKKIEIGDEKEYMQFPIKLAWAITIHKSQGMTLGGGDGEKIFIDLSRSFGVGLGYVALSRLKRFDNLVLGGYSGDAFKMSELVMKYVEPKLKANSSV